jgi:hypothetical protein
MRHQTAILTFPAHYHLTKLCIQSIRTHIMGHGVITVIVDDLSDLAWNTYYNDCQKFYAGTDVVIVPISSYTQLNEIWKYNFHPWVKQQLIKMHIDLIFENEIFFTDGDVIFRTPIPSHSIPYTYNPDYPGYSMIDFYTSSILKIDNPGMSKIDHRGEYRIDTAATPFRDIYLNDLKKLRTHVEECHGKNFLTLHKEIEGVSTFGGYCISEWEIIEVFKSKVLMKSPKLISCFVHILGTPLSNTTSPLVSTIYESEKLLPKEFWIEHKLDINKDIWDKITESKYIY